MLPIWKTRSSPTPRGSSPRSRRCSTSRSNEPMASAIQLPSLSPTMTEGTITKWLKKEGDKISSGEAVAEVETDKSNLEIEAYEDGYLLRIVVKEGQSAPVGAPIGYIGEKGEKVEVPAAVTVPSAPAKPAPGALSESPPPIEMKRPPPQQPLPESGRPTGGQVLALRREEPPSGDGRLRASPLAK